jgi:hypothetical protein
MYDEADDIEEVEQDRAAQRRRVMALENYRITSRRSMDGKEGGENNEEKVVDIELEDRPNTPELEQLDGTIGPPTTVIMDDRAEERDDRPEFRPEMDGPMIGGFRRKSDNSAVYVYESKF